MFSVVRLNAIYMWCYEKAKNNVCPEVLRTVTLGNKTGFDM